METIAGIIRIAAGIAARELLVAAIGLTVRRGLERRTNTWSRS